MRRLISILSVILSSYSLNAQEANSVPVPTENLRGSVCYYEETTYNIWTLRLFSGQDQNSGQTTHTISHPQSIICHEFDSLGNETVITRYVQRNANVGSIGRDSLGNVDFIANEISRNMPDTRTVKCYDSLGRLNTSKTWSFNMGDSTLISSDSCTYDSTGVLVGIVMYRDSLPVSNVLIRHDRNGSYSIDYKDGTSHSYRYDSDRFIVRYKDRDGKIVRYLYNERGNITRQTSEWPNGSTLNVNFENYQYDDFGNWTRCSSTQKDPGMPPRSQKIIERTYKYRF